jgi:D-alanine-D-alanine ligase-like ATP-grasp enzyme
MKLAPVTQLIPKNSSIKRHLKLQAMGFSTIPADKQKVYLHHKVSLKLGASIEALNRENISENNRQDLTKTLDSFNANILGIDVICAQGIEFDFKAQKCIFLELNSRPFLSMHDNPRYGKTLGLEDFYNKLNQLDIIDNEKY